MYTHDHHTGFETFFIDGGSMEFYNQGKTATLTRGDLDINAVRNPNRPLARFELEGVTLNMVVGRWETNGVREIWQAKMRKGFHAEWNDFPIRPELYYVTEGEVKFTVYGEEYIAHEDCLIKIPKFAPPTAWSRRAMPQCMTSVA